MGDFNPINPVDPFGVNPVDPMNMLTRNDNKPKSSIPTVDQPAGNGQLFKPYEKFIPEAMNSNQPIRDPSAILAAYRANLPEFQSAAGLNNPLPAQGSSLSERQQGK